MKPSGVSWHHARASRSTLPPCLEPWRVLGGAGIRQPSGDPATYMKLLHQGQEPGGDQCEPDCPGRQPSQRPEEGTQGHGQKEVIAQVCPMPGPAFLPFSLGFQELSHPHATFSILPPPPVQWFTQDISLYQLIYFTDLPDLDSV